MDDLEQYREVLSESQYKRLLDAKNNNDQNEFKHWMNVAKKRMLRKLV